MKVKQQNGVTLIEILLVVALLMFLLLAVFKVFNVDINRANDAQRKSDLRDIKLAFEDYYSDHQEYPPEQYLANCGGVSLQPYMRVVPCDPVTGEPYLYIPYPGNGFNGVGYRVLSILDDSSDPIIEKLGCQNGCGIPEDNPKFDSSASYVYGIAEGVPLVMASVVPVPTATLIPSATVTPTPTTMAEYCDTHLCYCCANSSYTTNQDCNVWVRGDVNNGNNCDMGPYISISQCYSETPCLEQ